MTAAQRREEDRICDVPNPINEGGADDGGNFCAYEEDVLQGRVAADISHAGEDLTEEEMHDTDRSLLDKLWAHHNKLYLLQACDTCTRRDRTHKLFDAFTPQLETLADCYLEWCLTVAEEGLAATYKLPKGSVVQETRHVLVVDMFSSYTAVWK
ncbi:hypothetical protein B0H17DRAFT_1203067 [Mycena rosella]|uniref:Uncharacterized protein n=1 Tax=Mycena rosella TaxID=1033263 RepID=A0AAD7DFG4_MYCRO|nr:hypothetical protein B0H17DRAFT_1203067 [Mycena rosella]